MPTERKELYHMNIYKLQAHEQTILLSLLQATKFCKVRQAARKKQNKHLELKFLNVII